MVHVTINLIGHFSNYEIYFSLEFCFSLGEGGGRVSERDVKGINSYFFLNIHLNIHLIWGLATSQRPSIATSPYVKSDLHLGFLTYNVGNIRTLEPSPQTYNL